MKPINLDRKLIFIILSVLLASQLAYFYINVQSFKAGYIEAVRANLHTVGNSLQINLDDLLRKGISIRKFFGLKSLLQEIIRETDEIEMIAVTDISGKLLYFCDRETYFPETGLPAKMSETSFGQPANDYRIPLPLTGRDNQPQGVLILGIDQARINRHVRDIALDTGTMILISILAILDFLFFVIAYTITIPVQQAAMNIREVSSGCIRLSPIPRTRIDFMDMLIELFEKMHARFRQIWERIVPLSSALFILQKTTNGSREPVKSLLSSAIAVINRFRIDPEKTVSSIPVQSSSLIRPALFLFVFSESLSISFLPLFAGQLYQPIPYLSKNIALGLPISAFMLLTTISLPIGGMLAETIGHRKSFLAGAVISAAGLLLTGSAETIWSLVTYRAISGFGFGIVFMTTQMFIVAHTTIADRAEGMAIFLSAFYGGTLCGSAIGGMLSDRIGFRWIFLIGAAMAVSATLFLFFISGRQSTGHATQDDPAKKNPGKTPFLRNLFTLFADRNFSALVLLQSIPNKICLIGFIYYLAPLFFTSLGSRQSDIGRYIMLYSLVMILFSQSFSRWTDRLASPKPFIFWGGLFSGMALLLCYFFQGVFGVALGITLLGLAHAFSVSNQAKLASQLRAVHQVGLGPGLSIYRQAERVGNVLAPILSGALLSQFGYVKALALMGVYTSFSSIIFMLVFSDKKESKD